MKEMNNKVSPEQGVAAAQPVAASRRHFLASVARVGLLGAMGTFFVAQRIKFNRLLDDPDCVIVSTCQKCIEFGGCDLPKSDLARALERLKRS